MLTCLVMDRAVGKTDKFTGKFGAPLHGNHSQLTQAYPWGSDSGGSYGSGGNEFDGDGAGPNISSEENHPYSATHQRNFGSLSSFH